MKIQDVPVTTVIEWQIQTIESKDSWVVMDIFMCGMLKLGSQSQLRSLGRVGIECSISFEILSSRSESHAPPPFNKLPL